MAAPGGTCPTARSTTRAAIALWRFARGAAELCNVVKLGDVEGDGEGDGAGSDCAPLPCAGSCDGRTWRRAPNGEVARGSWATKRATARCGFFDAWRSGLGLELRPQVDDVGSITTIEGEGGRDRGVRGRRRNHGRGAKPRKGGGR